QVFPEQSLGQVGLKIGGVAEGVSELGQGEIVAGVFEDEGGRLVVVVLADEAVGLVLGQVFAGQQAVGPCAGSACVQRHGGQGRGRVEVLHAHRVGRGDVGQRSVADHTAGIVVNLLPARQAGAALGRVIEVRLNDVGHFIRRDQGQQGGL